ncbi:TPA: hypothetical protein SAY52_001798 [Burkholderia cenocepacia]|uniref:DUF6916 family protein n=1 Tax=unclassified Burkholderia TaxID=2613784 RepID=UPI00158EF611|nr:MULTISPECIES: hypothetical protein [unclassified Burkholderia]HEF5871207.1 hypothetical protein [Burkholderia cenocepacia]
MLSIPTHAELRDAIGQRFTFGAACGDPVDAVLLDAPSGLPMNDQFVCYSATFALPAGVHCSQDVYRIVSPAGHAWALLATPTRPTEDGCSTLTIVVHCRVDQFAGTAGPGSDT